MEMKLSIEIIHTVSYNVKHMEIVFDTLYETESDFKPI